MQNHLISSTASLSVAAFIAAGLMGPLQSHGAVLVHDSFGVGSGPNDYVDGALINGQGHGTGWGSSVWDDSGSVANYVTDAGSIVPSTIASESGMLVRAGGNTVSSSVGREYAPTFGGATPSDGEVWYSFGLQRNESQREFGINPFDTTTSGGNGQFFGIYAANGSSNLVARVRFGGSGDIVTSGNSYSLTLGTPYFVVGQMLFNSDGTEDVMNVYVVESASYTGTLPGTPTLSVSYDNANTFDSVSVLTQNPQGNTDVLFVDEFRIGDTLADVTPVIPEPTSAALAGLAVAGLAGRRRR